MEEDDLLRSAALTERWETKSTSAPSASAAKSPSRYADCSAGLPLMRITAGLWDVSVDAAAVRSRSSRAALSTVMARPGAWGWRAMGHGGRGGEVLLGLCNT